MFYKNTTKVNIYTFSSVGILTTSKSWKFNENQAAFGGHAPVNHLK